jgi:hypothetical protein
VVAIGLFPVYHLKTFIAGCVSYTVGVRILPRVRIFLFDMAFRIAVKIFVVRGK